jgi:biotin operon repressor
MTANRNKESDRLATARVLRLAEPARTTELNRIPNWLDHRAKTTQLDKALVNGATMTELKAIRGAVRHHLEHLRKEHGLNIAEDGDVRRIIR